MQGTNARFRRDGPSDEREHRRARRAPARDPAHAARDEVWGQDARRVVRHNGEHRPQEEADEGDAYGVCDERWNEPNDKLETASEAFSAEGWDVRRDDADLPENCKYVYEDGASISDL